MNTNDQRWNENLEIEGDARDEIREELENDFAKKIHADAQKDLQGYDNLQTPEEQAEFEAWLDSGDFELRD